MIGRYNRSQTIQTVLAVLGGLVCCYLAYLFFRYLPAFALGQFGYKLSPLIASMIGLLGLGAIWISGYKTWKSGGGLYGYHESALYHDLGEDTAGAFVLGYYAHRVTAPAHILSQLFLAGPTLLLRARTLQASLLPDTPELVTRLEDTLTLLKEANKWQSLNEYPNHRAEILYLAQMGLIDFSAHKGTPRFKTR